MLCSGRELARDRKFYSPNFLCLPSIKLMLFGVFSRWWKRRGKLAGYNLLLFGWPSAVDVIPGSKFRILNLFKK